MNASVHPALPGVSPALPVEPWEDHEITIIAHAMSRILLEIYPTASQSMRDTYQGVFSDALAIAVHDPLEIATEAPTRQLRKMKRKAMATRIENYWPAICVMAPQHFQPTKQSIDAFTTGVFQSFEDLLVKRGQVTSVENLHDLDDPKYAPDVDTVMLNAPHGVEDTVKTRDEVLGAKRTPNMEDLLDDLEKGQRFH